MGLGGRGIAITATNAARAERIARIVIIGHMADMPSFRRVIALVGTYYGAAPEVPDHAGYGTALGALMYASDMGA